MSEITTISISTCNRPKSFRRALSSYFNNAKIFDRDICFIISDDSVEETQQKETYDIVRNLRDKTGAIINYFNKKDRKNYIKKLVDVSGVPISILEFAFFGDSLSNYTLGASRNFQMLLNIGKKFILADDDTICNVYKKDLKEYALELSQNETLEYWFYKDHQSALNDVKRVTVNFLELHEYLLCGKFRHLLRDDGLNIDNINMDFLKRLKSPDANVIVSYLGHVGDSGMDHHQNISRFMLEDNSLKRFINSESDYLWQKTTRFLVRSPRNYYLTSSPRCMGMNMGLDNSHLLPPFMPNNRHEDSIFGALIYKCFYHGLSGYLPYLIEHDPPESRTHELSIEKAARIFRLNDLVKFLILSYNPGIPLRNPEKLMEMLGDYLINVSKLPEADFKVFIYELVVQWIINRIQHAQELLELHGGNYDFYTKDLNDYIHVHQKMLTDTTFWLPVDINGPESLKNKFLKDILYKFGELLRNWSEIYKAAAQINKEYPPI